MIVFFYILYQRPFLDHAEHLTEDVVSVFPEADSLERYIMTVISLACEEEIVKDNCLRKLISFEVGSWISCFLTKNMFFLQILYHLHISTIWMLSLLSFQLHTLLYKC